MRREVELYFNESDGSRFWAYTPEARMRCGHRGEMELPQDNNEALEVVWEIFNRDDRPNRTFERSLSMGDVVTFDCTHSFAVTGSGFREVGLMSGDEIVTALDYHEPPHSVPRARIGS